MMTSTAATCSLAESTLQGIDSNPLDPSDLATILDAWQAATDRLQRTHESLLVQVKLLTDEVEAKNRELARRNRLADLGQMAAHVAHEVRNGIVPLKLYLGLLGRQTRHEPQMEGLVDKIAAGFANLESTVNDLLNFTTDREPSRADVPCRELALQVLDEISPHLRAHLIQVDTSQIADVVWSCDPAMVRRALINLLLNAVDAMSEGGTLTVQGEVTERGFEWRVQDDGPGISPEIVGRLFDPFVSTKPSGTGLGLAIVERIASAHAGGVEAFSPPGSGARFVIWIPDHRRIAGIKEEQASVLNASEQSALTTRPDFATLPQLKPTVEAVA